MEHRFLKLEKANIRQESDGRRYLEGYFAVFNREYEVCPGWVETIAPGAFAKYLASGEDTKVLWNHDSNIVLGSTANRTARLSEDGVGLFGSVEINEQDGDARNAYARIDRGDVDGCSFGFDIRGMDERWGDDGTWYTTITEVSPLYEVSPCTFPAYSTTHIEARAREKLDGAREKLRAAEAARLAAWKETTIKRLKGEKNA